jgi:ATP-dependent RNA helicase RhlE
MTQQNTNLSFYGLGVAPKLLETLDRMKFTTPMPIQHKAIPIAIQGKDIVGIAQTGTGKTLAFAIPMIQQLAQKKGRGLVLVPTRELAIQVDETFKKIEHAFGIKSVVLIGGASMYEQIQALRKDPRVLIATPGRLIDHLTQRNIDLRDIVILVLDEADRMLDMGFAPQIDRILRFIPKDRQTMLFSATIPQEIMKIAASHMKLPVSVEIAPSGTAAEHITQEVFIVRKDIKKQLLGKLLDQYQGTVLIFSRTKIGASKITRGIKDMGHRVAQIHSDRSLTQRREALDGFKSGKYRILVATDIAARGIDVIGIELVINYDLPEDSENYVHRIGRTGRAGHSGHAISFAGPDQGTDVRNIEKLIRTKIPISEHPAIPKENFVEGSHQPSGFSRYGRQQGQDRSFGGRRPQGRPRRGPHGFGRNSSKSFR